MSFTSTEQPVTEQSNSLTYNIDVQSTTDKVSSLYRCDQEIFEGWNTYQGINCGSLTEKMYQVSAIMRQVLQLGSDGLIVMSGCGTSGRLAFLVTGSFNAYLESQEKEPSFQYIMAGQDIALFMSIELSEDDPHCGAEMLRKATQGKSKVVFIGITCGLSAPFVAGQLDYCLSHLDVFTPVLLGFNPPHLARNMPIQNWNKTFLDVVKELQAAEEDGKGILLTPIIGPEPITGSSRMKSGSATKIILETLAIVALHNDMRVDQIFSVYQTTNHNLHKERENLSTIVQIAGDCLSNDGHIYYLGQAGPALIAMVDASECPPTFGAAFDDVRGFVEGGYSSMRNTDGNLSSLGPYYRISLEDFDTDITPTLSSNDLVILIGEATLEKVNLDSLVSSNCRLASISFKSGTTKTTSSQLKHFQAILPIHMDPVFFEPDLSSLMNQIRQEISVKWAVNCISTLAYVLKGKVLHNYMVDMRISNKKLFHRGLALVEKFSGRDSQESRDCLLKAIYHTDSLPQDLQDAPDEQHTIAVGMQDKVIPTAILLASLRCTIDAAVQAIQAQPVIRKLLDKELN